MTTALPAAPAPLTLDEFAERIRSTNPFLANRVDRPLASNLITVAGIHEQEFHRLIRLARQAQQTLRGVGAVIWGEAGVGKTHLLARLGRWAQEKNQGCFVYLHNFQVEPRQAGGSLLQGVLNFLSAGHGSGWRRCRLFRLLNSVLAQVIRWAGLRSVRWVELHSAYTDFAGQLVQYDPSQGVLFNPHVRENLFRFFQSAYSSHDGAGGPVEVLRTLAGQTEGSLAGNQHAKSVLASLALLAWSVRQPLLLCLDQVDNLEEEQIRSLSRFLHDLLDSAGNLLVVTTGVRETLARFQRGVITETSWDRIGQFALSLGRIPRVVGLALLRAYLEPLHSQTTGLPELTEILAEDPLFPLGSLWFEQRTGHLVDLRPRDLLGWAGERWQQIQDTLMKESVRDWLLHWQPEPIPTESSSQRPETGTGEPPTLAERVARWLEETRKQRRSLGELRTPNEDRLREPATRLLRLLADHGFLAGKATVQQFTATAPGTQPAFDLLVRQTFPAGAEVKTGVRFLVNQEATSTTAALRRLFNEAERVTQVLLVTDQRSELCLGQKGRKRLGELLDLGPERFRQLDLALEEILEADAACVILDRQSRGGTPGDGPALSTPELLQALLQQPRLAGHRLLHVFLCHPAPEPPAPANAASEA